MTLQTPPLLSQLADALAGVEPPLITEQSVKVTEGRMSAGRFLISVPRAALGPGPKAHLRRICGVLGAPDGALRALDAVQGQAFQVHFGCDPKDGAPVFKCYLEFRPGDGPEPDLIFLAAKWQGERFALARYRQVEGRAAQQYLITDAVADPDHRAALLAMPGGGPVLDVRHDGTARRSVDLNLAALGQTLGDNAARLAPLLGPDGAAYLSAYGSDWLGHIAAGTDRTGRSFVTLYHGARRVEALI